MVEMRVSHGETVRVGSSVEILLHVSMHFHVVISSLTPWQKPERSIFHDRVGAC